MAPTLPVRCERYLHEPGARELNGYGYVRPGADVTPAVIPFQRQESRIGTSASTMTRMASM